MKPLTLKPHEIRRLKSSGEVLVVREVPNPNPQDWLSGLDWSKCPYRPGDRLWVKENHYAKFDGVDDTRLDGYCADVEKQTGICAAGHHEAIYPAHRYKCSSAVMPRRWSRFTVEVGAVECKRVKQVSVDDLVVLGHMTAEQQGIDQNAPAKFPVLDFAREFGRVAWAENPWCWFVLVKKV